MQKTSVYLRSGCQCPPLITCVNIIGFVTEQTDHVNLFSLMLCVISSVYNNCIRLILVILNFLVYTDNITNSGRINDSMLVPFYNLVRS